MRKTVVVLSSDHGIVPLNREVRINNILAENGLLKYSLNEENGEYKILWDQTKAVFLKMDGIFISPLGLDGNYHRSSGKEYDALREEVKSILMNLTDGNNRPVQAIVEWEEASSWKLPSDRIGDLVIANSPGYGWIEEITSDGAYFADSLKGGYKQAIQPDNTPAMWTPFMIVGPSVKENNYISDPIQHVDQYPTLMRVLNEPIADYVEGKVVEQIFQ